jgi:hypothetical protein
MPRLAVAPKDLRKFVNGMGYSILDPANFMVFDDLAIGSVLDDFEASHGDGCACMSMSTH